jgi:periplasmic protein TonB
MSPHADILDEQESLSRPLVGSLALHAGVVVLMAGFGWWQQHNMVQWGSEKSLGGAIGVDVVSKVPLPNKSVIPNPVANDTEHSVPQKPEKVEKRPVPKEDPDAIALKSRKAPKKQPQEAAHVNRFQPVPPRPNQLYSSQGPAVNSSMYGQRGIGGVGIGDSTVAGRGCGGYLELVRQRIQSKWDAQPVSSSLRSGVVLTLVLSRNGELNGISILQSGGSEVDFSARRAISDASPFPPFLATCEGNQARIEVRFEPKR